MKKERHFLVIILVILIVICGKVVISPQCLRAENNGLLVYYAFDELTGTTALDSSGNDYHGFIRGASRVVGKVGGGLLFGADDAVVGVAEFINFDGAVTLEGWIKPYRIENGETYRILGDSGTHNTYFQIRDGRLEVCYNGQSYHYGTTQIPVDSWTRIAFTSDGKNITTYVNGALDKITNRTLPITVIGNVHLGANWTVMSGPYGYYVDEFPGVIDEFKIWDRPNKVSPLISSTPSTIAKPNKFYSFTPTASDPYGDELTFSISGKPSWTAFSTTTGILSGIPTMADIGFYGPITITVSDLDNNTDLLPPFTLQVTDILTFPGVYLLLQKE